MDLHITGRNHLEVTPAIKEKVQSKVDHFLKHASNITSIHVILETEKHNHHAEVQITLPGKEIHADAKTDDLYSAIDAMANKAMRQIDEYHSKNADHH